MQTLMQREIPVSWFTSGGWFLGYTAGIGHRNVELRTAQYRVSFDDGACLVLARGWVRAKIANSRNFLRRNFRGDSPLEEILQHLAVSMRRAEQAGSMSELLGVEGDAARVYFSGFGGMLKQEGGEGWSFEFSGRNRRPPKDPVNAMLSFGYGVLARLWTVTLVTVGFDPYRGFYHQPRYGRPALALDMMESFRPLLADSVVLTAINNGEVRREDFQIVPGGVWLSDRGRRKFLEVFERRLEQEITHPLLGYKLSYRRLLELQARLLARGMEVGCSCLFFSAV
ncbi:MAG: CRISPR-associated endonuclease Cas1 [Magnetococcus sp. DMHC-6]